MRISDWSADVGSSDLGPGAGQLERLRHLQRSGPVAHLTRGHTGQIAATSTPPICALRATILVLTCRLLRPGGGISARTFPCLPAAKGVSHDRISRRPAARRPPLPRTLPAAPRPPPHQVPARNAPPREPPLPP